MYGLFHLPQCSQVHPCHRTYDNSVPFRGWIIFFHLPKLCFAHPFIIAVLWVASIFWQPNKCNTFLNFYLLIRITWEHSKNWCYMDLKLDQPNWALRRMFRHNFSAFKFCQMILIGKPEVIHIISVQVKAQVNSFKVQCVTTGQGGGLLCNSVFWNMIAPVHSLAPHICSCLHKVKPITGINIDGGGTHKTLALAEELLTVDGYRGRKNFL